MPELLRRQIYWKIKRDILTGIHRPGKRLSANGLAKEYQVSATPVREALNALQCEGLVEVIPRVGCFVSQLTVKDIQDIFELRLIIESASAEMAAQNITNAEIADLEETLDETYIPGNFDSYWQYLEVNRKFHYRVALATGNKWLAEVVGRLLDQMQRILFLRLDLRDCTNEVIEEHRKLVAALKRRDGALARKAMRESIENARKAVLEAIMQGARLPIHPLG